MAASLMRRPMPVEQQPSRAAQRKQRLLELENEQRLEDLEALKMTEEQRLILFHSFRSVKFEWSDLDGMRYIRRRYNSPPVYPSTQNRSSAPTSPRPPPLQLHPPSPPCSPPRNQPCETFVVLTNRHTSPSPENSCVRPAPIMVPFPQTPVPFPNAESAPASPTPTITPRDAAWGTSLECTAEPTAKPVRTAKSTLRAGSRRLSSKSRSPMKGLFPSPAPPATASLTVPPIAVPRLLGAQDDDDEDAWIDDDDDVGNTTLRADDGDESLLATPVVSQTQQLQDLLSGDGPYQPIRTPVFNTYSGTVVPPTPTPATAEAEFHVGGKRKR
ncbi:hypothetical protein MIND_00272300 [Mycena indigotica]|uniref:Uncharacterized protein n=1 Tax=Mycena indigotica TaxID=2126181 RepID=A0A8H6T9U0_9AGAR|nr:uncharacterized protein MIND_00272300 [Mycena indigotica]KAF7312582.1 hypothetical protein MIND_00272300 [Mycena indigotica]